MTKILSTPFGVGIAVTVDADPTSTPHVGIPRGSVVVFDDGVGEPKCYHKHDDADTDADNTIQFVMASGGGGVQVEYFNVGDPSVSADASGEASFGAQVIVDGNVTILLAPTAPTPAGASHTVNPASATAGADLLWLGVGGIAVFQLNEAGLASVLDGGGVVVGHTAQIDFGAIPEFQVLGTATPDSSMGFARFENNASGPDIRFLKSRGATIGANTIVQDGDTLGRIRWQGADTVDFNTTAAELLCKVDGSPSSNDIPGKFVFRTRIAGGPLADRMTLDNAGNLSLAAGDFLMSAGASYGTIGIHGAANSDYSATLEGHSGGTDAPRDASILFRRNHGSYSWGMGIAESGGILGGAQSYFTIQDVGVGAVRFDIAHTTGRVRVYQELMIGGDLNHDGAKAGFYATAPIVKQTGVAVTAAAVHAALVNLGLIAA